MAIYEWWKAKKIAAKMNELKTSLEFSQDGIEKQYAGVDKRLK